MRKISICLLSVIVLLLAACGGGNDEVIPTAAPAADTLRTAPTATPKLPPTWTPEVLNEGQHLPGASAPSTGSSASQPAGPAVDLSQFETYTVQPGDTLGKIAEKFGVSVSAIAELNRITNIDRIEVGTVLAIPE